MRAPLLLVLTAGALSPPISAQQKPVARPHPAQTCGPVSGQNFSCPKLGFAYKIPFGWVDRTADMQRESSVSGAAPSETAHAGSGSETLLAVFERPPDAPGETIDSAVVVAIESLASYPQLKTAADYFGPVTEIAGQHGFKVVNPPYAFSVGAKELVRGDFSRTQGKLEMLQSSLVLLKKGSIISFTFIGGNEDEIEDLIANLSFAARASTPKVR